MCAGDLGMYRVMPWAYPPISGGTSGGFSPDGSTSEGGGSEGGSDYDPNAIFVKTDETVLSIRSFTKSNNSTNTAFNCVFDYGKFGISNVQGITKVMAYNGFEEVYFESDPSKNVIGQFSSNRSGFTNETLTESVTRFVTGTANITPGALYTPILNSTETIVKAVFYFEFIGYDADGNVVRSNKVYGEYNK